jgi:hypothetical protein
MEHTPPDAPRLDSWKEIAAYLGRDVRTAMRWAKTQGLPVRRVSGGKGHSVFAFAAEIDAWLKGQRPPAAPAPIDTPGRVPWRVAGWTIGVIAILATAALVASALGWTADDPSAITVALQGDAVTFTGSRGLIRSVHPFEADTAIIPVARRTNGVGGTVTDIDDDGVPDVLIADGMRESRLDSSTRSGQLLSMNMAGVVRWRFEFEDALRFTGGTFSPPWVISDWQISPGPGRRRIAVSAHHGIWWPGIVAVLDDTGRRVASFVNTGWVEHLEWMDNGRLLISGFDNARDGGMLALLDARHAAGHAPDDVDQTYRCQSCPDGDPLLYVVFPRSEINTASSARFNGAQIHRLSDRIVAMTSEYGDQDEGAIALYEFDLNFNFLRAAYGDRYWAVHHRLEQQGVLHHAQQDCATKNGPTGIDVWTRAAGWRHIRPGQPIVP